MLIVKNEITDKETTPAVAQGEQACSCKRRRDAKTKQTPCFDAHAPVRIPRLGTEKKNFSKFFDFTKSFFSRRAASSAKQAIRIFFAALLRGIISESLNGAPVGVSDGGHGGRLSRALPDDQMASGSRILETTSRLAVGCKSTHPVGV